MHSTKCLSRDWRPLPSPLLGSHRGQRCVQFQFDGSFSSPAQVSLGLSPLSSANYLDHHGASMQFARQSLCHLLLDRDLWQRIQRLHFAPVASWLRRAPPPRKVAGSLCHQLLHSSLQLDPPASLGLEYQHLFDSKLSHVRHETHSSGSSICFFVYHSSIGQKLIDLITHPVGQKPPSSDTKALSPVLRGAQSLP